MQELDAGPRGGRVVVVTGVSSGLGAAIARRLRTDGFVVVGTVRTAEDARRAAGRGVEPVVADVTDPSAVAALAAELDRRWPRERVAGLVNNAGVGLVGPLEHLETDELRHLFEVNVFGVHRVTRALLPRLRAARGRIVNVSSVAGLVTMPFLAAYAASKHALESLSDGWRRELLPFGVRVVVIEPEALRSRIWDKMRAAAEGRFERSVYAPWFRAFARRAERAERRALGPEPVAEAVSRAMLAPDPPLRILVAPRTGLGVRLMQWAPARLLDERIARALGGPVRASHERGST
ncbi:MAG: SDR family oxidoreductase [Acidobacteria bacterium]|nr:MAG: SDR family oxidoreductase [Acidobacteriota bacterium]